MLIIPNHALPVNATPADWLRAFFETLYGDASDADGMVCIRIESPKKQPVMTQFFHPRALAEMASTACHHGRANTVRVSVNLLQRSVVDKIRRSRHRGRGGSRRGRENELQSVTGLFVDLDAGPSDKHRYPPRDVAMAAIEAMPLPPTMIIQTGRDDGGLHVYWLFDRPAPVADVADRVAVRMLSDRWQGLLRDVLGEFELDHTSDLARMGRPPGTTNLKYGLSAKPILIDPGRRYTLDEFEGVTPSAPPPAPRLSAPTVSHRVRIHESPRVVGGGRTSELSPIDRAWLYLATIPGAVQGQHGDSHTFYAACILIRDFDLSVDAALPLFEEWNRTCQPPWNQPAL